MNDNPAIERAGAELQAANEILIEHRARLVILKAMGKPVPIRDVVDGLDAAARYGEKWAAYRELVEPNYFHGRTVK